MKKYVYIITLTVLAACLVPAPLDSAPASRLTDIQACPLFCGTSGPHVGGPIITGSPNVTICGLPAARKNDLAQCQCGGNPVITTGSNSVFINGLPAARSGDLTSHGGSIQQGCGSVQIGP